MLVFYHKRSDLINRIDSVIVECWKILYNKYTNTDRKHVLLRWISKLYSNKLGSF